MHIYVYMYYVFAYSLCNNIFCYVLVLVFYPPGPRRTRRTPFGVSLWIRPIFLLRFSLLRFLDSAFPVNYLWTWEFQPIS